MLRIWLMLMLPAALLGLLLAHWVKNRAGSWLAALIPWFALLGYLLYDVYQTSYNEIGGVHWIVTQLLAGSAAAFVGYAFYSFGRKWFG